MAARPMPRQKPGKSEQVVVTQMSFIRAISNFIGPVVIDLAATAENKRATIWYGPPETNSLHLVLESLPAKRGEVIYCNPEFQDAAAFARLAWGYKGPAKLGLLTPASINSNWFRRYIHGRAAVYSPTPKLTFEGHKNQYPKDLIFSVFTCDPVKAFEVWEWKKYL